MPTRRRSYISSTVGRWRRAARIASKAIPLILVLLTVSINAAAAPKSTNEQVLEAEQSFAKAMSDRDLAQFSNLVSDEAVFFDGTTPLKGKKQVLAVWSAYFLQPRPPFSWQPDQVVVLESGTLALSTGPVSDPSGKVIARFNSVWRLESPGVWRIVFDKGSPPSPGPK